jgi:hypothetical protein
MATVLEIIQPAYRRSGVLGAGVTIDKTKKDVGLELLQDLYRDLCNGTMGQLRDKYLTSNTAYTAQEFERVFNTAAAVVTLPTLVRDFPAGPVPYSYESTLTANSQERPPCDGCVIQVVVPGSDPHTHIYDSGRGEWQDIEALALTTFAPLSSRYTNSLRNLLAAYIADDVGTPIGPVLAKRASAAKVAFASRHGSTRPNTPQEFF